MKQKLPVLICTLSLILLFFPTAHAEGQDDELTVLVGLAYDSHATVLAIWTASERFARWEKPARPVSL